MCEKYRNFWVNSFSNNYVDYAFHNIKIFVEFENSRFGHYRYFYKSITSTRGTVQHYVVWISIIKAFFAVTSNKKISFLKFLWKKKLVKIDLSFSLHASKIIMLMIFTKLYHISERNKISKKLESFLTKLLWIL